MDNYPGNAGPNVTIVTEVELASMRSNGNDRLTNAHYMAATITRQFRPSFYRSVRMRWQRLRSFVLAIISLATRKRLTNAQYEARLVSCLMCDARQPSKQFGHPVGFCGACGCGTGRFAELTIKANMPAAKCPKNRWPVKGKRSTESPTPLEVSATKRTLQQTDSTDSPTPLQS